jgi:integrase
MRAVPLRARALAALDALPREQSPLVFPASDGRRFDLHNFRTRYWRPAQEAAGIEPRRRVHDLRHTFATFALRAGISTFDLSRYMGASLRMIDRHYGHLARDGREHAIHLLDAHTRSNQRRRPRRGCSVDVDEAVRRQSRQRKHTVPSRK